MQKRCRTEKRSTEPASRLANYHPYSDLCNSSLRGGKWKTKALGSDLKVGYSLLIRVTMKFSSKYAQSIIASVFPSHSVSYPHPLAKT